MYTHFWEMAREILSYCRETGLRVRVKDGRKTLTCGFVTDCPADDPRHREWRIRIADLSLTANDRQGGFDGLSEEDMIKITTPYLSSPTGREKVAEMLSSLAAV